ncbi:MAG: restriction endonuclease subunit S [Acinetobacter sp.]|uniref:restriction endonuclease subunit S n=1 Tax=Acinetobacter sp. TaxID=472 RepID=UPI000FB36B61|nr:restriction endonuclease subunit S [Acinetobacter sp.]RUP38716.1 MAG: restriction endonuclease subunit S [Acinetobacter sp.]
MREEKIPQGYKKTEVGVIPDDWDMKRLKEISPSQSVGLVINPSSYYSNLGTVPMLVGSQIFENKIKWATANKITVDSNSRLPASRLNQGDLVTVRVGDPGVTAVIPSELDQSNCASMMIIRQSKAFDSYWLCFLMNSRVGRSQIESVQYGTAQKQFNIVDAVDFLFPFPSKKEQTAIATALSDVDALICELEKIISKKQAIKTATMQQLLTGKTRLPQFALREDGTRKGSKQSGLGEIPEDWEVVNFGQCIKYVVDNRGKTPPLEIDGFPMLEVNAVFKQGKSPNIQKATKFVSNVTYENWFRDGHPQRGDILVVTVGSAGETSLVEEEGYCIAQNLISLRLHSSIDSDFVYYLTVCAPFKKQVEAVLMGAVQPSLKVPHLKKFSILLPASKHEQTAIATILSDMDEELQALEQRLGKTRQIKQGMMQELLTGKTRLLQGTVNT